MQNCVFCKIISGSIPTKPVFENEQVLAFPDINPKAPVHILIIPKSHIITMDKVLPEHELVCSTMFQAVSELWKLHLDKYSGFNIVCNNGRQAGQLIDHLHWHFIAGKNIYSSGFSL